MRSVLMLAVLGALGGCPGASPGDKGTQKPVSPPLPGNEAKFELPAIPAKIDVTSSAPTDGNSPSSRSPVLDILKAENDREIAALKATPDPAYYLAYQLVEQRVVSLEAEGGALITDSDDTQRNLDVEVRVGSPQLDNTRALSDDNNGLNAPLTRRGVVPFGEEKQSLTSALWLETDRRYHEAVSALGYVKQDQATLTKRTNDPDFVAEAANVYVEKPAKLEFDKSQWVDRLKKCSAKALKGAATRGTCGVLFQLNTAYYVNSEGSQIQLSWTNAQMSVSVGVKADDGMNLSRLEQRFGRTPADLPPDGEIDKMIKEVSTDLDALHDAPLADPYVGPAILQGRASGVFFHEVFGHRIEGHRQKDTTSGRTFASYVGKDIAPDWLSVFDDPQIVDAQRRPAQRLLSLRRRRRQSAAGAARRQGQARRLLDGPQSDPGLPALERPRPSLAGPAAGRAPGQPRRADRSLSVPYADLEKMLLEEVKKQKRPYGMVFTDISGGFTNTSAFAPQAFKVNPVMAYRLYPDGQKELVRGIDISGTPLVALQSIRAASREIETFNGVCGAESGWVPVSASAPSLLIERLEVEKGFIPPDRPPLLDAPNSIKQQEGSR